MRVLSSLMGKQALLVLLLFQVKCRCCQGSQGDVITLDIAKHRSLLLQFDNGCRHLSFSFPLQPAPASQPKPHSVACCHMYRSLENVTRGTPAHTFTFPLVPHKGRQVTSRILRFGRHSPERSDYRFPECHLTLLGFPPVRASPHLLLGLKG